jgi:hypothetical protein
MKGNNRHPIANHAVVILSEAKDLWFFFWLPERRPEMFRFAQHDSMELAAWCRASELLWMLELEVGD